jgi:sphinganine-1-phosphate aldolase
LSETPELIQDHDAALPRRRRSAQEVLDALSVVQHQDLDWRAGRHQGLVYSPGDDEVAVALEAMRRAYYSNPLLADVFPGLRQIESDILRIASSLLNAPRATGVVTTGGTESNLLAVWSALRAAREHGAVRAQARIIVPFSAHPTFDKACQYFGIDIVRAPLTGDYDVDVDAVADAITPETILLVGSAPEYSHGIVDPIGALASLAEQASIPLHVDGCVGGFMLPFVERLGRTVPTWDFRVPGVTSISADVHKHGLGPKGVSVLLTRDAEMAARTTFHFENWPHGDYTTSTIAGSRSGAALAGAWAIFQLLGEEGFLQVARAAMGLTDAFLDGIRAIPGIAVIGDPPTNKFAYTSTEPGVDIMAVADGLVSRGWYVAREADPEAIGMQAQPFHAEAVGPYLADLAEVTELARTGKLVRSGARAAYN